MRDTVKELLGAAAVAPGLAPRARNAVATSVNVIYTHYVGEWVPYYAEFYAGQTLDRFDALLRLLGRHFEFASLPDLLSDDRPRRDRKPRLAVTFDDGFDLLANGVVEVLERHGVKATTFVVTATVGNGELMWRHKLSAIRALTGEDEYVPRWNEIAGEEGLPAIASGKHLMAATAVWPAERKEELANELWIACGLPPLADFLAAHAPYFTWPGLERWLALGHGVGLHTATHPYCSLLDAHGIETEIVAPAELLRRRLGISFLPLSYPFGDRVGGAAELELRRRGVVDTAFGIRGFAPRGTPRHALERACIENAPRFEVFARPLARRLRSARF